MSSAPSPLPRGAALMARLNELARHSDEPGRLTRLYLSPAHRSAARLVAGWMEEAGMSVHMDAVGNVIGRYAGQTADAPALLLGSHIDTVRDAGKYDGNLGVLAAIQAVAELNAQGERLPVALEVIAFGDEEGVRFPVTLSGSRAIAGTLDPSVLEARDADGIRLGDALAAFGGQPDALASARHEASDVAGYVELHIEQGPVLESEDLAVGIVTAISGASRFTLDIDGEAGHAGTVPMHLRHDAVAAAAEIVLAVEDLARRTPDLVATVGCFTALPGAVNVIAAGARLTLDIRSPRDEVRLGAIAQLQRSFDAIAARRGVALRLQRFYEAPAVACDDDLQARLARAVERQNIAPRRLPSGAGHDGLAMAALCPVGMLFVRCAGGVSHSPTESITVEDAGTAVAVLLDFLRDYAPPRRPAC
ncbi:allantoate amidohydrolase [Ancylobacter sp. IITR112]|uniref:allantoate amidohydrolase n=1 Tax=Ancylobacter sp. IITR112 TaxID=3138073 RepID=UPI00352A8D7E